MSMQNSLLTRMRRGMTLIELLIVCYIIVLFVAVAAPLLLVLDFKPNNAMADVITSSYFPNPAPNDAVPFTIRLGNLGSPSTGGPWYQGLAIYQPSGQARGIQDGRAIQYFVIAQY